MPGQTCSRSTVEMKCVHTCWVLLFQLNSLIESYQAGEVVTGNQLELNCLAQSCTLFFSPVMTFIFSLVIPGEIVVVLSQWSFVPNQCCSRNACFILLPQLMWNLLYLVLNCWQGCCSVNLQFAVGGTGFIAGLSSLHLCTLLQISLQR